LIVVTTFAVSKIPTPELLCCALTYHILLGCLILSALDKDIGFDGKTIVKQWIPGHYALDGNERADALAKRGVLVCSNDPFCTIKRLIKNTLSSRHYEELGSNSFQQLEFFAAGFYS
jgi:hypothetical protein